MAGWNRGPIPSNNHLLLSCNDPYSNTHLFFRTSSLHTASCFFDFSFVEVCLRFPSRLSQPHDDQSRNAALDIFVEMPDDVQHLHLGSPTEHSVCLACASKTLVRWAFARQPAFSGLQFAIAHLFGSRSISSTLSFFLSSPNDPSVEAWRPETPPTTQPYSEN